MFKALRLGSLGSCDLQNKKATITNDRDDNNDVIVFLNTELHCNDCADRIKRIMFKHYRGIKYIHADIEGKKLSIIGEVDPKTLRQVFEDLTHQKAEFVSALFVKEAANLQAAFVGMVTQKNKKVAAGDTKKTQNVEAGNNRKQAEEKLGNVEVDSGKKPETKEENSKPRENTILLTMMDRGRNCDVCVEKVKKIISKYNGVDSVAINHSKDLLTINGTCEAEDLLPHLQTRLKTFSFKVVSPEKEDKKDEGRNEPTKKMEDHEVEPVIPPSSPTPRWWCNGASNYYGVYSPNRVGYGYQGYVHGSEYPDYGYVMEPRAETPPTHHMFSDDNPNACFIM